MKRILLAVPFIAFMATSSYALEPGCNPAKQNWQNGSLDTCPVADAGGDTDAFSPGTPPEKDGCYGYEKVRKVKKMKVKRAHTSS